MQSLFAVSQDTLKCWFAEHQQPAFRLRQLQQWLFQPGVTTFEQMSNLPKALREQLAQDFCLRTTKVLTRSGTESSSAEKFLLELADGNTIECVLLHNEQGQHTLCASTQVGCAMGCAFCASGLGGVVRNLTADEILEEFLIAADHLKQREKRTGKEERLSHAVIMGMGEPTMNLDSLLKALDVVTSPTGMNIGARKITISTVGIPQGIERLADAPHQFHLAISLHAPNDEIRSQIIPANRGIGIANVLRAAESFFRKTGRRVTYEYILIDGLNDTVQCAEELARLLRHQNAIVNLIPYNPVEELPFRTPSSRRVEVFSQTLEKHGIAFTVRHRKGDEIDAACGQLRRKRDR